ncbi:MAG: hypothetical protein MUP73_07990, partial [Dehalococcoidia bacterium]|nr:hypothetical protein [Dehalococcoidia bacterium]
MPYIFLALSLITFIIGLYYYFRPRIQISHFSGIGIRQSSSGTISTEVSIIGQFKTGGEGFLVGEIINISALLYFKDKELYENLKNFTGPTGPKIVFVENSENPEHAFRDVSDAIKKGSTDEAFTNPGTLEMVRFYDDKQHMVLDGNVVFTKEGQLTLGMPLKPILNRHNIRIEEIGISIAPHHIRYQIRLNRLIV